MMKKFLLLIAAALLFITCTTSVSHREIGDTTILENQIAEIINRPEFERGSWGMEFTLLDTGESIYSLNREEFFQPASTMKVFTAGLAFEALGADYIFRTPLYRTGPIVNGVLQGDLVLVGSGDMLLGGRINSDGTINLPETDHTYGTSASAVPVSDFPLGSLYELAELIAASGIRSITGNIIVDDSMFPLSNDNLGGTGDYSISPIMINDNLIDIWVIPGAAENSPAQIIVMPETPYVTFINNVITSGAAGTMPPGMMVRKPGFENDTLNPDGTRTVTITGSIALDSVPLLSVYSIPDPARFAEAALAMILGEMGIAVNVDLQMLHDFNALSVFYADENLITELISPSLAMQLMPMMKLSSNMHTAAWPHVTGAIARGSSENASLEGLRIQAEMFSRTGVEARDVMGTNIDFSNLSNVTDLRYSPISFTNFLRYIANQSYFNDYLSILPVLGVDGTLTVADPNMAAIGNVFAKTGGGMNSRMVDGQRQAFIVSALAGYIILPDQRIVTFSVFTDYETNTPNMAAPRDAINEIVNAVYEFMLIQ